MDWGDLLGCESLNMTHKHSRVSNEWIRGNPSSRETLRSLETVGEASDKRHSSGMRILSNESVNKATGQSAQDTVGDSTYLNRLNINTPHSGECRDPITSTTYVW